MCAPKDNRFEGHLDSQSFPLIFIKKDIIGDTFLHGPVVVIDNFLQILVDDALGDISLEDGKIGDFFLVGFDLVEGGDVVDDGIDPDGFDVGDVVGLYFI